MAQLAAHYIPNPSPPDIYILGLHDTAAAAFCSELFMKSCKWEEKKIRNDVQMGLGWGSEPRYSREESKVDAKGPMLIFRSFIYQFYEIGLKRGHKICSKTVLKIF